MGAELSRFEDLLSEQDALFGKLRSLLAELIEAARAKDSVRVSRLTQELMTEETKASRIEARLNELVAESSAALGLEPGRFKLSLVDAEGRCREKIDAVRRKAGDVARAAAEAGGVLSANVEIIEETVKVLESIDARGSGYGPSPERGPARAPKLIDRTA